MTNKAYRPGPKRIAYCLTEAGCMDDSEETIEAVRKAYRGSKRGPAHAMARAICRVMSYPNEDLGVILPYVEDALEVCDLKISHKRKKAL